ncbi:MAG TPA: MFS transporter [Streptosporangiaceae bacterium]|nr:MFS transporter [Streptosporangiaceae bacterium]
MRTRSASREDQPPVPESGGGAGAAEVPGVPVVPDGAAGGGDGGADDGGGLWAARRRALTTGLALTITFIASEALAVVTVMPLVARDLGGLSLYGWVFSAFMLGSVVGIVVAGREADRRGPGLPYVAGLVLFAAGLLIAGLAPAMPVLVAGRALQGLGAGAVPAVAYVAIGRSLPDRLRPRMMAVLSTAWVAPGVAGPALSVAVAHLFGWRWVFLGLVPVVAVTGSLAIPALFRLGRPPQREAGASEHRIIDGVGTAAGAGLFLAGLTELSGAGAGARVLGAVLVVAGGALGFTLLRRLLPAGTMRARRGLPATILARAVLTFAFFGADAYVTLTVTTVRHDSAALAGVVVTGSTLGWTAGAWVQARLSQRWAGRRLVRTGLGIVLVGQAGMALILLPSVPVVTGLVAWTVAGVGMGLAYAPISLLMLAQAPRGREGWASASLNLMDVLGTAIGTGIGGAAVADVVRTGRPVADGVAIAFGCAAAVAVAGLAITRRLPGRLAAGAPPG